jgi:hypothetical protein
VLDDARSYLTGPPQRGCAHATRVAARWADHTLPPIPEPSGQADTMIVSLGKMRRGPVPWLVRIMPVIVPGRSRKPGKGTGPFSG